MKTTARNATAARVNGAGSWGLPSTYLRWVTEFELEDLRSSLTTKGLPVDLEMKLNKLATGNLSQRFIEQNCRTILTFLTASLGGVFTQATDAECDRLLRVLTYVRKDDDAIPDYQPDGFLDDQQEVRAVSLELEPLLQKFKAWRLRHQVPIMWLAQTRHQPARHVERGQKLGVRVE